MMLRRAPHAALLLVTFALCACDSSHGTAFDGGTPSPDGGGLRPDGGVEGDSGLGPMLHIHVRTNTDAFTHLDGYAGQTSRDAYQGIRRFELLRSADDRDPLVLFDHGDAFVEAGYNDGDDTLVASVPVAGLRPGHYTLGRNVVTHSRYRVDAVMHASGLVLPGEFDNVQVLSEGTEIDGVVRPQSWFRYIFRTGGMDYPLEGTGAPLPTEPTTTGGFTLTFDGGEAAYAYPLDITLDTPTPTEDLHIVMEVNMFEAFRWEDQDLPGYADGVLDSTPIASEPVRRFGANSLDVYLE